MVLEYTPKMYSFSFLYPSRAHVRMYMENKAIFGIHLIGYAYHNLGVFLRNGKNYKFFSSTYAKHNYNMLRK